MKKRGVSVGAGSAENESVRAKRRVKDKKNQEENSSEDRTCIKKEEIPVSVTSTRLNDFSDHRQVKSLRRIFDANPEPFKRSLLREAVSNSRPSVSSIRFPSNRCIEEELGSHLCEACKNPDSYRIPEATIAFVSEDELELLVPREWIQGAKQGTGEQNCPSKASLSQLSISSSHRLHELRHGFAHAGGWTSMGVEDRMKIAHAIKERLASSDRIRFAHVERLVHPAEMIQEYWAELLAFAFGIAAERESEWHKRFLARAVQRGSGAPLAYPMPETGERDLRLVEWYLDKKGIEEPWKFASQSNAWIADHEREDRRMRVRHAISGFPPGRIRMVFSVFLDLSPVEPEIHHQIQRVDSGIPQHLAHWVERACLFADEVGALNSESDESSLLGEATSLAAELNAFSETDQRQALAAVERHVHHKVHSL